MAQELPDYRRDQLHGVAHKHYFRSMTMDAIAKEYGVSRSTISRMLKRARETGVVRITLADPVRRNEELAAALQERFGVAAQVVTVDGGVGEVNRLEQVARAAALMIGNLMTDGLGIGCAWGTTLASVIGHLEPRKTRGSRVVQINGGANPRTSGIPFVGQMISQFAHAFDSEAVLFPVPTFFDRASTRDAMWQERSIKPLLAEQRKVDVAVFGVGALAGLVSSHVYVSGYLDESDRRSLVQDDVVGDVCTVFLRRDGSWRDIELNARSTGLNPDELRTIKRRICIVAGTAKTEALLGAMRAGVATDLVVDDALARSALQVAGST